MKNVWTCGSQRWKMPPGSQGFGPRGGCVVILPFTIHGPMQPPSLMKPPHTEPNSRSSSSHGLDCCAQSYLSPAVEEGDIPSYLVVAGVRRVVRQAFLGSGKRCLFVCCWYFAPAWHFVRLAEMNDCFSAGTGPWVTADQSICRCANAAKAPAAAVNSSKVPASTILPSTSTMIRSANLTVLSR